MTDVAPVHINATDFYRAVTNILPFASADANQPAELQGIHFVVDKDKVWVAGTDPFAFAFDRAMLTSSSPAVKDRWSVTVPREKLDVAMQALTRERKALESEIVVLYDSAIELVRLTTIVRFDPLPPYPDFRRVIPDGDGQPIARITAAASLLKKLTKVEGGKLTSVRLFFHGELNTIEAQVGATFRAFLMPQRVDTPRSLDVPPLARAVLAAGVDRG